jgi:recombination protein RecA
VSISTRCCTRCGAWINYGKIRLGQGRENAKKYLIDYPEVRNELKDKVLSTKGLLTPATAKSKAGEPVEAEA